MTMSKGPCSASNADAHTTPSSANSAASCPAFSSVRLAMTTSRGRSPGTQQQQAASVQRNAGILYQVAHEPGTVGVVALQPTVGVAQQSVYRSRLRGTCAVRLREAPGFFLERHGDVAAGSPLCEEG